MPIMRGTNATGVPKSLLVEDDGTLHVTGATAGGPATIADGADVTFGAKADAAATTDTGTFTFMALVKRLLAKFTTQLPAALGQTTKAASLAVTRPSDDGSYTVIGTAATGAAVSGNPVYIGGKDGSGNVQPLKTTTAGGVYLGRDVSAATLDTRTTVTLTDGNDNVAYGPLGVAMAGLNGTTFNTWRTNQAVASLASAARTASANADVTVHNGRSLMVILNITATPNNSETLTVSIRAKDSISGNYVTLLTGSPITASVINASLPNTTQMQLGVGLSVNTALARTMNVLVTHSSTGSWTYSVSAEVGV